MDEHDEINNRIQILYTAFTKSYNHINELFAKLPNIIITKEKSRTPTEEELTLRRKNELIKNEIMNKLHSSNKRTETNEIIEKVRNKRTENSEEYLKFLESTIARVKTAMDNMQLLMKKKYEENLKFIENEKMMMAITKKIWEEKIIPSAPVIQYIILEIEYCETILNDIDMFLSMNKSIGFREMSNNELEKKRIDWISTLHKLKEQIKPLLIDDDDVNSIENNILELEKKLVLKKDQYTRYVIEKNECEYEITVIGAESNITLLKERICMISDNIYGSKISIEMIEISIASKQMEKLYYSGYKEHIQKLNNCVQTNIDKHSVLTNFSQVEKTILDKK